MISGASAPGYLTSSDLEPGAPAWFCRHCRTYFPSLRAAGKADPRECPTPGCENPNGFGRYGDTPRPR